MITLFLNLGTFTNNLTTHSNCSLHEPSLAEHRLREPPRKKQIQLKSTVAEMKGPSSLHCYIYHSKAIASFPGSRLGPGNEANEV